MAAAPALENFRRTMETAEALLANERGYRNPPPLKERPTVEGLRGGCAVLMVAGFESYLRELMRENVARLTPAAVDFDKLPDELRQCNFYTTLDLVMKGPKYANPRPTRVQRVPEIKKACAELAAGIVRIEAFEETNGNPSSANLRLLFKNVGLLDIFASIHPIFERKWKRPIAVTFVPDKLDEIVQRRHRVAHTGQALDIARGDLRQGLKFLRILAELLNKQMDEHVRAVLKSAAKP